MKLEHISAAIQIGLLIAVIARSIYIFYKTRSTIRLILSTWLWIFTWSIVVCVIAPLILYKSGYSGAFARFPEMPGVVALGFMGWLPGIYLAIPIWIFRIFSILYAKLRSVSKNRPNKALQ